ncbi:MAG: hypothetical protein LBR71_01265, partial [Synergistaceae bacterium]|nr:hypothetical protein [Synergistaceae bacterium]
MKKFCGVILSLWAASAASFFPSAAVAEYLFDDLYSTGASGVGAQWMAVTTNWNTAGSPTARRDTRVPSILVPAPMDTEANLVIGRNPVYLTNGGTVSPGEPIDTLFLVLSGNPDAPTTEGALWVSFDSVPGGPNTQDVEIDFYEYLATKEALGTSGSDRLYRFDFTKRRKTGVYESLRGNFIFHQNPNSAPSQTLQVPFIIANVYNGTAEKEPLRFRSSIRDAGSTSAGNIVAHDRFTWKVASDTANPIKEWVFVPIDRLPADSNSVNYRITTEVANYTGIRYAVQRYDGRASYYWIYPTYWAFDVPSTGSGTGDVLPRIHLNELSHIPPGLVTVYNQNFNVVSGVRETMHLYPVDPATGYKTLTIAHRSIVGLDLGATADPNLNPASYIVTGFKLQPAKAEVDFLSDVARTFGVPDSVRMPETTDGVMPGSVEYANIGGDVIASVGVSAGVPGRIRNGGRGLLPLHVTFNLRRTNQIVSQYGEDLWENLRDEWRNSGNIEGMFSNYFSVYLQDAFGNNLNLFDFLSGKGAYEDTVKVFFDEQREVITIHFIALLLDGPNSSVRLVKDTTPATDNTYIAAMDGSENGRWEMKFFVAPARYVETDRRRGNGSGCGVGLGISAFLACASAILAWRRK